MEETDLFADDLQSIAEIPGVGIIRARTLRKAGWANREQLLAATVEQLRAVPGISSRKALEIVSFLQGATEAADVPELVVVRAAEPSAGEPETGHAAALQELAARAGEMLRAPRAAQYGADLAKQIGRVASLVDHLAPAAAPSVTRPKRLLERVQGIHTLLSRVEESQKLPKKGQKKLAEQIRGLRRKIQDALEANGK